MYGLGINDKLIMSCTTNKVTNLAKAILEVEDESTPQHMYGC